MLAVSKIYAVCMIVAALVWALLLLSSKSYAGLVVYVLPLLLHAGAQMAYSFHSQRTLFLRYYEDFGTLDEQLFFEADGKRVMKNANWAIALAAFASFFELCIAFMAVRFLPFLSQINTSEPLYLLFAFVSCVSLSMGIVTALYNLRSWNRKGVAA